MLLCGDAVSLYQSQSAVSDHFFYRNQKVKLWTWFRHCQRDLRANFAVAIVLCFPISNSHRLRIVEEMIDVTAGIFATGLGTPRDNLRDIDIGKNTITVNRVSVSCMFPAFCVWIKLPWVPRNSRRELQGHLHFHFSFFSALSSSSLLRSTTSRMSILVSWKMNTEEIPRLKTHQLLEPFLFSFA